MKKLLLCIVMSFVFTVISAQDTKRDCADITNNKDNKDTSSFVPDMEQTVTFTGANKAAVLTFLKNSSFIRKGDEPQTISLDTLARRTLGANWQDSIKVVDGKSTITLTLTSFLDGTDSFTLVLSCDGSTKETRQFKSTKTTEDDGKPGGTGEKIEFISPAAIEAIRNGSACDLCELRKTPQPIESKRDRIYSTNYIVLYDPLLKKDAYTICKHIFYRKKKTAADKAKNPNDKKNRQLYERYRKVDPKWFAPKVGSQIRFEIVNRPLTETVKITVDAHDFFNTQGSKFESIINAQVSANIVDRLTATGKKTDPETTEESFADMTDLEKLKLLHAQLLDYMSVFRLSSCTIDEHYRNLPTIIANINKVFGTSSGGAIGLATELKKKFAKDEDAKTIVEEISNLLISLNDVKPVAYTTLRAKNRDYLNVKMFNAANTEIANENIRMSGGLKIDFSAGFVLTGLRDFSYIMKDTTVQYQRDPSQPDLTDTSGNMIIKENTGNRQVGVGLLAHIYPRISSNYNLGVCIGLMSSTELDLRFMLGGSTMFSSLFGSNNRISFSGGVVWGKVKRLSNAYYEGYKEVNAKPVFYPATTAINTVTVPVTEHSWFFAVTMNFGGN